MAKRGEELRGHILAAAKDVLLELGFERSSMDLVAARAGTTKRSLYAHFENKDALFTAAIDLVRENVLRRVGLPEDYQGEPAEALASFLNRYLEIMLQPDSIRLCRLCIGESGRFHDPAAHVFERLFTQIHGRVSAYIVKSGGPAGEEADAAAHRLFGQVLHPRFTRALFGIGSPAATDGAPLRAAVAEMLREKI